MPGDIGRCDTCGSGPQRSRMPHETVRAKQMAVMKTTPRNSLFDVEPRIARGVALVGFSASWSAACLQQAPIIERLAEKLAGRAVVIGLDVDDHRHEAATFGIVSIPTMSVFKDGREVERFVGLQAESVLLAAVQRIL